MGQRQGATVSTEPEQTEDDFQKELIELFGQEAQEWLIQIHSALTELDKLMRLRQPELVAGLLGAAKSSCGVNVPLPSLV